MRKILFILLTALAFTACQPFKISLSNGLKDAPELRVKDRNGIMINQKLSFGDFQTEKINRSWTEGGEQNMGQAKVLWISYSQKRQSMHITMTDKSNNKAEVFCLTKVSAEDYNVGRNPNSIVNITGDVLGFGGRSENKFVVSIFLNSESNPWEMILDNQQSQKDSKTYIGYLAKNKDNYYTIHPVTTVEKNGKQGVLPIGSAGFEIRNRDGKALAAVSLMNKGLVYLADTDAKEKFLLANACAALLLQENIG